jgi:hypothetical protein
MTVGVSAAWCRRMSKCAHSSDALRNSARRRIQAYSSCESDSSGVESEMCQEKGAVRGKRRNISPQKGEK